jgi:hypothetical protein
MSNNQQIENPSKPSVVRFSVAYIILLTFIYTWFISLPAVILFYLILGVLTFLDMYVSFPCYVDMLVKKLDGVETVESLSQKRLGASIFSGFVWPLFVISTILSSLGILRSQEK